MYVFYRQGISYLVIIKTQRLGGIPITIAYISFISQVVVITNTQHNKIAKTASPFIKSQQNFKSSGLKTPEKLHKSFRLKKFKTLRKIKT